LTLVQHLTYLLTDQFSRDTNLHRAISMALEMGIYLSMGVVKLTFSLAYPPEIMLASSYKTPAMSLILRSQFFQCHDLMMPIVMLYLAPVGVLSLNLMIADRWSRTC
jgi:hypothetical protein